MLVELGLQKLILDSNIWNQLRKKALFYFNQNLNIKWCTVICSSMPGKISFVHNYN